MALQNLATKNGPNSPYDFSNFFFFFLKAPHSLGLLRLTSYFQTSPPAMWRDHLSLFLRDSASLPPPS